MHYVAKSSNLVLYTCTKCTRSYYVNITRSKGDNYLHMLDNLVPPEEGSEPLADCVFNKIEFVLLLEVIQVLFQMICFQLLAREYLADNIVPQ